MKKIVKGAFTKFLADCEKCGCQFEYELKDIWQDAVARDLTVVCPDCGFYTSHYAEEGVPSSRKEIEPDKPEEMGEGWCAGCYGRYPKLFLYKEDNYNYWLCEDCYKKGRVN